VLQILRLPFASESRIYGIPRRTLSDYVSHSEEALTIVRLQEAGFEFTLSQLHRFGLPFKYARNTGCRMVGKGCFVLEKEPRLN
jgi:hypothetical protein